MTFWGKNWGAEMIYTIQKRWTESFHHQLCIQHQHHQCIHKWILHCHIFAPNSTEGPFPIFCNPGTWTCLNFGVGSGLGIYLVPFLGLLQFFDGIGNNLENKLVLEKSLSRPRRKNFTQKVSESVLEKKVVSTILYLNIISCFPYLIFVISFTQAGFSNSKF